MTGVGMCIEVVRPNLCYNVCMMNGQNNVDEIGDILDDLHVAEKITRQFYAQSIVILSPWSNHENEKDESSKV